MPPMMSSSAITPTAGGALPFIDSGPAGMTSAAMDNQSAMAARSTLGGRYLGVADPELSPYAAAGLQQESETYGTYESTSPITSQLLPMGSGAALFGVVGALPSSTTNLAMVASPVISAPVVASTAGTTSVPQMLGTTLNTTSSSRASAQPVTSVPVTMTAASTATPTAAATPITAAATAPALPAGTLVTPTVNSLAVPSPVLVSGARTGTGTTTVVNPNTGAVVVRPVTGPGALGYPAGTPLTPTLNSVALPSPTAVSGASAGTLQTTAPVSPATQPGRMFSSAPAVVGSADIPVVSPALNASPTPVEQSRFVSMVRAANSKVQSFASRLRSVGGPTTIAPITAGPTGSRSRAVASTSISAGQTAPAKGRRSRAIQVSTNPNGTLSVTNVH